MTELESFDSSSDTTLTVLGSRGSIPVSGEAFRRYGGNTTSMAVSSSGTVFAFIDAGTALNAYGAHGLELRPRISVFLTHYHWDHIQGLSMLSEMWDGNCSLEIHGPRSPEDLLTQAISPPWFPVPLAEQSNVTFGGVDIPVHVHGVTFTSFPIHHPQGAVGYRIDGPGSSVAILTDHETTPESTAQLQRAVEGVDTVIYDAQYLPREMPTHIGWGHSSWEDAVQFASDVGASELVLTSHDPGRSDDDLDAIVLLASQRFPNVRPAIPGLEIRL